MILDLVKLRINMAIILHLIKKKLWKKNVARTQCLPFLYAKLNTGEKTDNNKNIGEPHIPVNSVLYRLEETTLVKEQQRKISLFQ